MKALVRFMMCAFRVLRRFSLTNGGGADFQFAGAEISNPPSLESSGTPGGFEALRNGILRYSRLKICATPEGRSERCARRPFIVGVLLFAGFVASAPAMVTSLYIFGDGVSTTTNNTNPSVASLYYGHRFCNGRVWVEVLAQRQGVAYIPTNNWSYFGHYSSELVTNVNRFTAPPDASTALFIVWVSDADFVYDLNQVDPPYTTNGSLAAWTSLINQSLTNHLRAIQTLYAKGARTLLMPNAVDVSKAPYYAYLTNTDRSFVRQRVMDFNTGLVTKLNQARATLPGLTIYMPDLFALLDDISAHPANYGMVNPGIDAINDPSLADKSLNGPGTNYLFWDYLDPTAMGHARVADVAQQLMSPVNFSKLTPVNGASQLDVANVPVGRNGFVEASTNFLDWTAIQGMNSTNVSQRLLVPVSGAEQYYRLRFPSAWSWP
ncbi:MAG TPA: SGNH/GDSL hydrolase family protein [Candidatus Acidoferrum sp.]|nr:SGNH/GDSL hydrolase family protein [Candidatus Acidoferrum sp.]